MDSQATVQEGTDFLGRALERMYGPAAILEEEQAGQHRLIAMDRLPAMIEPAGAREAFERMGIVFLEPVVGNPLFVHAQLPAGWRKVASNDAMLSLLVDDRGRERARIFYKASHHDPKASLILTARYGIHESCFKMECLDEAEFMAYVTDGGVVTDGRTTIFTTDVVELVGDRRATFRATRAVLKEAEAWLDTHYPNWRDPFAYWD